MKMQKRNFHNLRFAAKLAKIAKNAKKRKFRNFVFFQYIFGFCFGRSGRFSRFSLQPKVAYYYECWAGGVRPAGRHAAVSRCCVTLLGNAV